MKVVIFSRRGLFGRRFYFRIVAANGELLTNSEGYHNRRDAMDTIDSIMRQIPVADVSEVAR